MIKISTCTKMECYKNFDQFKLCYDKKFGSLSHFRRLWKGDHALAWWREQNVIEYMYIVYIYIYIVDMYDIDSGGKVTTLQPGGENKMWSNICL